MGSCLSSKGVVKKSHVNKANEFQKLKNNEVKKENILIVTQVNQSEPNNQVNQPEPNEHKVNQPVPNKQEVNQPVPNKQEKLEMKSTSEAKKKRSSSIKVGNILNLRSHGRLSSISRNSLPTKI